MRRGLTIGVLLCAVLVWSPSAADAALPRAGTLFLAASPTVNQRLGFVVGPNRTISHLKMELGGCSGGFTTLSPTGSLPISATGSFDSQLGARLNGQQVAVRVVGGFVDASRAIGQVYVTFSASCANLDPREG